jgi:hypothetical protein
MPTKEDAEEGGWHVESDVRGRAAVWGGAHAIAHAQGGAAADLHVRQLEGHAAFCEQRSALRLHADEACARPVTWRDAWRKHRIAEVAIASQASSGREKDTHRG